MKINLFSNMTCKKCTLKWKLPNEARRAADKILNCSVKKCPFQNSQSWDWYDSLLEVTGPDKPAYPDDPHEGFPNPIQGIVYGPSTKDST